VGHVGLVVGEPDHLRLQPVSLQLEADVVKVGEARSPVLVGKASVHAQRLGAPAAGYQIEHAVALEALVVVHVAAADDEPHR